MISLANNDCRLRGRVYYNRDLSELSTWRVGGNCERFYRPRDAQDLSCFLRRTQPDTRILFLGRGSNVLFPDKGIRGCVIGLNGALAQLSHCGEIVRADAGVTCQQLVRYCIANGLGGLEFLIGIPGSVGGALAMNAGALGSQIWEMVQTVTTINRQGNIRVRKAKEFIYGYRFVSGPEEWFLAAQLVTQPRDIRLLRDRVREILKLRKATQPVNTFSCGSVFKNPPGTFAGHLIEQSGQKGRTVGDAEVSHQHANFIVNRGSATASDILSLIIKVQDAVQEKTGICLKPEVKIIEP